MQNVIVWFRQRIWRLKWLECMIFHLFALGLACMDPKARFDLGGIGGLLALFRATPIAGFMVWGFFKILAPIATCLPYVGRRWSWLAWTNLRTLVRVSYEPVYLFE